MKGKQLQGKRLGVAGNPTGNRVRKRVIGGKVLEIAGNFRSCSGTNGTIDPRSEQGWNRSKKGRGHLFHVEQFLDWESFPKMFHVEQPR